MWRTFNAKDQILQRYPPSQLSEGGALATQSEDGFSLMTTGTKLTEGRHYWEVELVCYFKHWQVLPHLAAVAHWCPCGTYAPRPPLAPSRCLLHGQAHASHRS